MGRAGGHEPALFFNLYLERASNAGGMLVWGGTRAVCACARWHPGRNTLNCATFHPSKKNCPYGEHFLDFWYPPQKRKKKSYKCHGQLFECPEPFSASGKIIWASINCFLRPYKLFGCPRKLFSVSGNIIWASGNVLNCQETVPDSFRTRRRCLKYRRRCTHCYPASVKIDRP